MTALLLTSLSPLAAWTLWRGLTLGVAWLICRGHDLVSWLLGLPYEAL